MKLLSINTAEVRPLAVGNKTVSTGIFKLPRQGAVKLGPLGLEGDNIVHKNVHGGRDQALYLYSSSDYQWWSEQLGREIAPGTFGENLTISDFHAGDLRIGDRLVINDEIELEITAPRVPCAQFAAKMEDPSFGKKFVAACKPGAYARVISGGMLQTGQAIKWQVCEKDYATINEIFIEWHQKSWSKAIAQKALASPISNIARGIIESRSGLASQSTQDLFES